MQTGGDRLDEAATVLLCGPSAGESTPGADRDANDGDEASEDVCRALLEPDAAAANHVVWVTFDGTAPAWLDRMPETVDRTVVTVGQAASESVQSAEGVRVKSVSTRSDLTALGITMSQYLSSESSVTVCFDSVTAMLDHVDLETAYEFLHTITRQFYSADATGHFHIDSDAHDETTVATITSLCDAVVQFDPEPTARVRPDVQ